MQYVLTLVLAIGVFVGINNVSNPGLYGIVIVFLLQFSEVTQWILRQIINMESIMVSAERNFKICNLVPEA